MMPWIQLFHNFQESSIIEAVEKQLQGTSSASSQPSLTPQMGKKPQMGTHVAQQHQQQQQIDAITPLSGEKFLLLSSISSQPISCFFRFLVKVEHLFIDWKIWIGCANAKNHQQARETSAGTTKANQVEFYLNWKLQP